MSASPIARQACSHAQAIPSRKVLVTDPNQMPDVYSSTPNGTLYSTTPGGTRIIYERAFLMNLKNSPLSRTPPKNLPPSISKSPSSGCSNQKQFTSHSPPKNSNVSKTAAKAPASAVRKTNDDDQFDMDL